MLRSRPSNSFEALALLDVLRHLFNICHFDEDEAAKKTLGELVGLARTRHPSDQTALKKTAKAVVALLSQNPSLKVDKALAAEIGQLLMTAGDLEATPVLKWGQSLARLYFHTDFWDLSSGFYRFCLEKACLQLAKRQLSPQEITQNAPKKSGEFESLFLISLWSRGFLAPELTRQIVVTFLGFLLQETLPPADQRHLLLCVMIPLHHHADESLVGGEILGSLLVCLNSLIGSPSNPPAREALVLAVTSVSLVRTAALLNHEFLLCQSLEVSFKCLKELVNAHIPPAIHVLPLGSIDPFDYLHRTLTEFRLSPLVHRSPSLARAHRSLCRVRPIDTAGPHPYHTYRSIIVP